MQLTHEETWHPTQTWSKALDNPPIPSQKCEQCNYPQVRFCNWQSTRPTSPSHDDWWRRSTRHFDILEVGTPLILAEGVRAIETLRTGHPGKQFLADLKIMDVGEWRRRLPFATEPTSPPFSHWPTIERFAAP